MDANKGYAAIAGHYRRLITSGELTPGDPLPTVNAVAEQHGVARNTAVRAYDLLKREGLITTRAGAGTVVSAESHVYQSGSARVDRIDGGGKGLLAGETTVEHRAGMRSVDDVAVAAALGLDLRDEIAVRTRVFVRDGQRRVYAVSCYHVRATAALPELPTPGPLPGEWHQLYRDRTGREVHRSPERYSARIATPDELRRLHISDDTSAARAVLVASTVFHDEDGPLAYWEDIYAPGLSHLASK
ncbi:GntR family transcriptional regulator [Streptomyces subrutilus]|uniref:GntR family transcriptional regulator n=1 Tax=Streptomyces subrutilus TaxID=36818 RepID=UPI00340380A4